MTRPSQIALVLLVFVNGLLLGAWRSGAGTGLGGEPPTLVLAAVLVLISAASIHLANEAADHETDRLTRHTHFSGGSGALVASGLNPRMPLMVSLAIALGVTILAVVSTAVGSLSLTAGVLLLTGLFGGLAYSLPPIAAQRRGLGEILNALLGAMVLPLFGVAVVAAHVEALDVTAFLPFLLVTFVSVMATAWPDRDADSATGKRTLQVRLRPALLRRVVLGASLAFVAATLLSALVGAMPAAVAGLLVLPALALGLHRYTRVASPAAAVVAMVGHAVITFIALAVAVR